MKKLKPTGQYKQDYKRFRNNPKKVEKLFNILELLQMELPIPEENRPHPLTGDYAGHMECHIEGDFLLIWFARTQTKSALSDWAPIQSCLVRVPSASGD